MTKKPPKKEELPSLEQLYLRLTEHAMRQERDVFDYIEMFYNPKRYHVTNGMRSNVEFEKQQKI